MMIEINKLDAPYLAERSTIDIWFCAVLIVLIGAPLLALIGALIPDSALFAACLSIFRWIH